MASANLPNNSLTLHVVLATVPRKQEKHYPESIKEAFYTNYIKSTKQYYKDCLDYYSRPGEGNTLYNPLTYYIFGNYDIAFITLVDSYKFAQKLFSPINYGAAREVSNPNSFQILTGISSSDKNDDGLREFFKSRIRDENPVRSSFIGICNLKLNNGLLIGNGHFFYSRVTELIRKTVTEVISSHKSTCLVNGGGQNDDFLTLQSFSWFEISLVLFAEDPSLIANVVSALRDKTVSDLGNIEDLLNNCLYNYNVQGHDIEKIKFSHLFADTHTYFGVHTEEFMKPDFMDRFDIEELAMKTKIEWQVKPGHLKDLLKQITHLGESRQTSNIRLITGKTDYYIPDKDSLSDHHDLIQILNGDDNNLHKYVKKIKTKIEFAGKIAESEDDNGVPRTSGGSPQGRLREEILQGLAVPPQSSEHDGGKNISTINDYLKALKISRQIRSKIIKIFYSFNNGIKDSILFIYFIDFKVFIDELVEYIEATYTEWQNLFYDDTVEKMSKDLTVKYIEESLVARISIFEEGYTIRMLNCYLFEDINDFDLDFNSSIQQLLTTYNMLLINIGNLFFDKEYQYAPIVQLNLKDTVANYNSINYSVYHLLSPEFVFFTATKEILNFFRRESFPLKKRFDDLSSEFAKELSKDRTFATFIEEGTIDFDYLFIDVIRYYYICNLDFKLFSYWFWMYNFQNSSLYDTTGIMAESHFKKELFRLMFVGKLYNVTLEEHECPLPEIQNYWERYYYEISRKLESFFKTEVKDKRAINSIKRAASEMIKSILEKMIVENKDRLYVDIAWRTKFGLSTPREEEDRQDAEIKGTYESRLGKNGFKGVDNLMHRFRSRAIFYFQKKYEEDLKNGIPVLYSDSVHESPHMFINALMNMYLKIIYEENGGKVRLLRRNWKNGNPLTCFINNDDKGYLYNIDQTGSTFFTNPAQLNRYFKMRNAVLQSLWHFSLVQKKPFITKLKPQ